MEENTKVLSEAVDQYMKIKEEKDKLDAKLSELKEVITEELQKNKLTKFITDNQVSASMVYKTKIDYKDELAMIKWLEENNQGAFVVKSIMTTKLNNEIKKNGIITEGLKTLYEVKMTPSLTVEKQ